jgi:hypothetical protein
VFQLRGKILNVLKADLHKALQNKEISGMIDAFGLEVKDGKVVLDEAKLRYGKIIITADADVDGSHIRILFLTFIWKFCPELIEKGYIYAAVPPLYKITMGTNIKYLKDDAALEAFRKSTSKKFELGRMKGLGEMDPPEMEETVMNPKTRTLKQITMDDATEVAKTFMNLMGESVGPRKSFIEDNLKESSLITFNSTCSPLISSLLNSSPLELSLIVLDSLGIELQLVKKLVINKKNNNLFFFIKITHHKFYHKTQNRLNKIVYNYINFIYVYKLTIGSSTVIVNSAVPSTPFLSVTVTFIVLSPTFDVSKFLFVLTFASA